MEEHLLCNHEVFSSNLEQPQESGARPCTPTILVTGRSWELSSQLAYTSARHRAFIRQRTTEELTQLHMYRAFEPPHPQKKPSSGSGDLLGPPPSC